MSDIPPLTYADAGVDIDAGNALVDRIKPLAKATNRAGVMAGLGGFGAMFDLKAAGFNDPILVAATDGVGTKLKIAIETNHLDTIGIDLVAMCVNDLICQGAVPLFFLDYFATGKLDVSRAEKIISGIAQGCKTANAALIGGETAEMPGMYAGDDFDLAGFAIGAMERGAELPRDVKAGDVIIGLPSSGLHSNGYSLVRKIIQRSGLGWDAPCPFEDGILHEHLLTPTTIYVRSITGMLSHSGLHALAHITGGGLSENLPRVLPDGLGAQINLDAWQIPAVFDWLIEQSNLPAHEALKTFNCGIGLCLIVAPDAVDAVLQAQGAEACVIGQINTGDGIAYSGALR